VTSEASDPTVVTPPPANEPAPPAALPVAPGAAKLSFPRRVLEWLWSSRAMAEARARSPGPSKDVVELLRRARLVNELAQHALEPQQPLDHGPAHAVACDLYRQSIYWILLARRRMNGAELPASLEYDSVWSDADAAALAREAGQPGLTDSIARALGPKTFVDFGTLTPEEQQALATSLRLVSEPLVDQFERKQVEVERIWIRRTLRLGLVLACSAGLAVAYTLTSDMRERATDIALGKPWTASSKYPEAGCTSPAQKCPESPNFFFHTWEENDPWIIFDLQKSQSISGVRVVNRPDCCPGRGIPLVVEVSDDQKHWKEVARRTRDFSSWRVSFPEVKGRYVKLHSPTKTLIHLQEVRIFP